MLTIIALIQISTFLLFYTLEYFYPNNKWTKTKKFNLLWSCIVVYSLMWMQVIIVLALNLPESYFNVELSVINALLMYLAYSFVNYWIHRFKHSNRFLWRYFHKLHHSPEQMEVKLSYYRHPVELFFNTLVILAFTWFFGLSVEFICIVLSIEGVLEIFHHSNIKMPQHITVIEKVIQTPRMHLAHHEYGIHKHNYSPVALWDVIFNTHKAAEVPPERLGFSDSSMPFTYFFLKNK